jgi:vancomycin permeability regulator SanA
MEQPARFAIVTTSYHVFRSLIIARKQHIKCVGYGAKTKWYFTLNATIREFIGYLSLTRKMHIVFIILLELLIVGLRIH